VWVEQTLSLQPSFEEIVSSCYKATLSSADFINNVCFYLSLSSLQSIMHSIMHCFYFLSLFLCSGMNSL
jgi:hypothetical protein